MIGRWLAGHLALYPTVIKLHLRRRLSRGGLLNGGGGKVRSARCEVVKCEVPVRGINARRWVMCEAGMCEAQRTTGTKGVVVGCETLKRN